MLATFCGLLFTLGAGAENPLSSTITLLEKLHVDITADGVAEQKAYEEYAAWCHDAAMNTENDIKVGTSAQAKLEASVAKLSSDISVSASKITELLAAVGKGGKDLAEATALRNNEAASFAASERELLDSLSALSRAVKIISEEMKKNPAAFAQVDMSSVNAVLSVVTTAVEAAGFSTSDRSSLISMIQSQNDEDDAGAPAAAAYKSHSSSILDLLEDLRDKAHGELSALRKAESNAKHNFNMLKQSLDDEAAADTKDMNAEKSAKASAAQNKANAEGDLTATVKSLTASKEKLRVTNTNCAQVGADHDASVASRSEELGVVADAIRILKETTSGASGETYSFVQLNSRARLAGVDVVTALKDLASEQHSSVLAQLASQVSATFKFGASSGDDVFGKVKGLISQMIGKLEQQAGEEAAEKAYCDEQTAKTNAKKLDLEDTLASLTAKIDQAAAKSAGLKREVRELQGQLATIAREQATMDKIRQESHADYVKAKADLELGIHGVQNALSVLRGYYAKAAALVQQPELPGTHIISGGAGTSIIGLLEVVESDFSKNLAHEETEESDALSEYEKVTQENKIAKTAKGEDDKYKTREFKGLDKEIAYLTADKDSTLQQQAAVLDYLSKIDARCIAKPETYAARSSARAQEINGLKEALRILENDTAFLQNKRRNMRGALQW